MVAERGTPEAKPPSLFMLAGEASGDFHAALLGQEIARLCPEALLSGVGGARMSQAGFHLFYDSRNWGAMGFSQAAPKIPGLLLALKRLVAALAASPPDVAILVDFGAFNLRFGPCLKRLGIPVLYYFPPASWSREAPQAQRLRQACDIVVSPFPWSAQALRDKGLDARFFGHPLLDVYGAAEDSEAAIWELETRESKPCIGLFPGSRRHEIRHILPHLLAAAVRISDRLPEARFVVSQTTGLSPSLFSRIGRGREWARLALDFTSDTAHLLRTCTLALATSGSITLEAALCALPMVVVYRGSLAMWVQYRLFLQHLQFMAMPNILAGAQIVPELRQQEASGERIAEEALDILLRPELYAKMKQDLIRCVLPLQPPGAVGKVARLALELANKRRPTGER